MMNFKVEVPREELIKRRLLIATPMYGGMCTGAYASSLSRLMSLTTAWGVQTKTYFLQNESLITRARNYCSDVFMRSDCTNMIFIDSDIGFDPMDVLKMLAIQDPFDENNPYDVICGPYPKKAIAWEKVKSACDKGLADEDAQNLEKYVGDYVFNVPKESQGKFSLYAPTEVLDGGTGFMMIRKRTFEKYEEKYPQYHYLPDHRRTKDFDGSREIMAYFDCVIDPESKRYLSEDYFFTQNCRKIGMKVWLCPWMKLQHIGTYTFGGSLIDLAQAGQVATVDLKKIKK